MPCLTGASSRGASTGVCRYKGAVIESEDADRLAETYGHSVGEMLVEGGATGISAEVVVDASVVSNIFRTLSSYSPFAT